MPIRFTRRTPDNSIRLAEEAITQAAVRRADIICFPECYVPGYRRANRRMPPPDAVFLEHAWARIVEAAARANVAVILGTERFAAEGLVFSTLVINRDGTRAKPGRRSPRRTSGAGPRPSRARWRSSPSCRTPLNVHDGGEVARELDRLYTYMSARLLDVTAKADDGAAQEVHKLLTTLREGWSQIAAVVRGEG